MVVHTAAAQPWLNGPYSRAGLVRQAFRSDQQSPHTPCLRSSSNSQRQLVAGNSRFEASASVSMVARSAATASCRPGYCRGRSR